MTHRKKNNLERSYLYVIMIVLIYWINPGTNREHGRRVRGDTSFFFLLVTFCHEMSRHVTNKEFSSDFSCVIFTMDKANGTQNRLLSPFSFAKE